jgi:predicted Rossmann-fold nucleotide-binding protein
VDLLYIILFGSEWYTPIFSQLSIELARLRAGCIETNARHIILLADDFHEISSACGTSWVFNPKKNANTFSKKREMMADTNF